MFKSRLKSIIILFSSSLLLVSCGPRMPNHGEIEHAMLELKSAPAVKIYTQATAHHKDKEYSLAIAQYNALIKLHPASNYSQLARTALIDCYRINGQLSLAIKEIDMFLQLYPNSKQSTSLKIIKHDLKNTQRSLEKYDMFGLYPYWGDFTPYGYVLGCLCIPFLPPVLLIRYLFFV
jgi:outer membrane protein assembly factor BamD (BamD/ComL family)